MFYREAGQFKTNYREDSAIFPILQDRIGLGIILWRSRSSPFRFWEATS